MNTREEINVYMLVLDFMTFDNKQNLFYYRELNINFK